MVFIRQEKKEVYQPKTQATYKWESIVIQKMYEKKVWYIRKKNLWSIGTCIVKQFFR